jgi:hypothetical protein
MCRVQAQGWKKGLQEAHQSRHYIHPGQNDWNFVGDFLYFSSVNSTSLLSIKVNSTKISNYFATIDFSKNYFYGYNPTKLNYFQ